MGVQNQKPRMTFNYYILPVFSLTLIQREAECGTTKHGRYIDLWQTRQREKENVPMEIAVVVG